MTDLISEEDFAKALKLEKVKLNLLAPALMRLLKLDEVNEIYSENSEFTGADFAEKMLERLGVEYEVSENDLANIPKTGPFILIANHPYGGIDAIILTAVLVKLRPDIKFIANFLLKQIKPFRDYIIPVNPFDDIADKAMNIKGIKDILEQLKTSPIAIFPAGEVSSLKLNNLKITDKKWEPGVGKIIAKAGLKVVPVYFSGHNSLAFNLLGLVHPGLRTIKLPSEMFNKSNQKIKLRIGKPIPFKELQDLDQPRLMNFLRAKTYALGASEEQKTKFKIDLKKLARPQKIVNAISKEILAKEIETLPTECKLFKYDNFEVYISDYKSIPNLMHEIGRLREITFRDVGEGTNRSIDLDDFDKYYKHLFVWDKEANAIAGSYRIGEGDELFKRFGVNGFYLNQLFKMSKEMYPMIYQSIELGRSFVPIEYQKKPASLMLLWKGINLYIKKQPHRFRYMIGPVSISSSFSNLSKDLLVAYIRHNHWDSKISKWIEPKKRFSYTSKAEGKNLLLQTHSEDIKRLDNFIGDIEGNQKLKIPVLVKKYLKLNGKIVSFNVDPNFNDSLDGFLIVDIAGIPDDAFEMVNR
jgi:putative hemolysin